MPDNSQYDDGARKGAAVTYEDGCAYYRTEDEAENPPRGYTDTSPDGQVQKSGKELGMDTIGTGTDLLASFKGTDVQTVK